MTVVRDIYIGRNVRELLAKDPRLRGKDEERHSILRRILDRRHELFDGNKPLGMLVEDVVRKKLGPACEKTDYSTPISGAHEERLKLALEQASMPEDIYIGPHVRSFLPGDPRLIDDHEAFWAVYRRVCDRKAELVSGQTSLFRIAEEEIVREVGEMELPQPLCNARMLAADIKEEQIKWQILRNQGNGREAKIRSDMLWPLIRNDTRVVDQLDFLMSYRQACFFVDKMVKGEKSLLDVVDRAVYAATGKRLSAEQKAELQKKTVCFEIEIVMMDQFGGIPAEKLCAINSEFPQSPQ